MVRRTAVTLSLSALMLSAGITSAFAQTVDDIVAKHYATKGGAEKWQSIQTQIIVGTAWGQGTEVGMALYMKRPNLFRQEITVEIPGQPAFTMVSLFDGVKAWQSNPMAGSDAFQELMGAEAAAVSAQADFDEAFLDYRARGYTVELVGIEDLGANTAHHLKVTRGDLPTQHYYLDVETGVTLQASTEATSGLASVAEYSDYRTVDGVQVAHQVRLSENGVLVGELRVETVEFNTPIDDAWFKGR